MRQNDKVFITETQSNNEIEGENKMSKNFTELSAKEMNTTDGGFILLPFTIPVAAKIAFGVGVAAGAISTALKK